MKEIGAEIGVNESRVSQLHARAIKRLRESLGQMTPQHVVIMREALVELATSRPAMAKAALPKIAKRQAAPQRRRWCSTTVRLGSRASRADQGGFDCAAHARSARGIAR